MKLYLFFYEYRQTTYRIHYGTSFYVGFFSFTKMFLYWMKKTFNVPMSSSLTYDCVTYVGTWGLKGAAWGRGEASNLWVDMGPEWSE
jgi:hypothetical protein